MVAGYYIITANEPCICRIVTSEKGIKMRVIIFILCMNIIKTAYLHSKQWQAQTYKAVNLTTPTNKKE